MLMKRLMNRNTKSLWKYVRGKFFIFTFKAKFVYSFALRPWPPRCVGWCIVIILYVRCCVTKGFLENWPCTDQIAWQVPFVLTRCVYELIDWQRLDTFRRACEMEKKETKKGLRCWTPGNCFVTRQSNFCFFGIKQRDAHVPSYSMF